MTTSSMEEMREKILNDLDLDFMEYTPDQGMPPIVYEVNEAQLDYIITQAHQAGIDEAVKEVEHFIWQEEQIQTNNTVRLLKDLKKALQDNK